VSSPVRLARITGVLYLILGAFGGFAELYVRAPVRASGDAAATAGAIAENAALFRFGMAADLVGITSYLLVAMGFYLLFRHVNRNVAGALVLFVTASVVIQALNNVNHFAALRLATDGSYATALGADGADGLVLLFVEMQATGFRIAQIFFGLWLVPLGYLAYRSGYFPRPLGVVLIAGGLGYLVDLVVQFAYPHLDPIVPLLVVSPSAIGEIWMIGYLLVKGVRLPRPAPGPSAAA
jgi:Domain of unknown function (DUF4386)